MMQSGSPKNVHKVRTFQSDAAAVANMPLEETKPVILSSSSASLKINEVPPLMETSLPQKPAVLRSTPLVKVSTFTETVEASLPRTTLGVKTTTPQYEAISSELQSIARPHKQSILSDDHEFGGGNNATGSIIRDTKRKRFQLFPAMMAATSAWFSDTKEAYEEAVHPLHPVAKVEARLSVVQKAAQQSELAPKEDFKMLADRLKTMERKNISSTLTFKEKSTQLKPAWSHVEEEEVPAVHNDAVLVQETPVTRTPSIASPVPATLPQAQSLTSVPHQQSVVVAPVSSVTPASDAPHVQTPLYAPEPPKEASTPFVQPPSARTVVPTTAQFVPQPQRVYAQAQAPASSRSSVSVVYISIGVVIFASLLGIAASFYFFAKDETPQVKETVYEVPQLIDAQTQASFPLPQERLRLLSTVVALIQQSEGIVLVYPTVLDASGIEKPASTELILESLQARTSSSFNRAVQGIVFGGINANEPYIVIKTTSFDTAFAGMLEWEDTLSSDLYPLFGEVVTQTFDAQARTDTQVRSAFFKDIITSNKNSRILMDEQGRERIVYTFVDQNTIVITSTKQALDMLLPLIK